MPQPWLSRWLKVQLPTHFFQHITVYAIRMSHGANWEPERAQSFMENMLASHVQQRFGGVTFQIVAQAGQVLWQLVDFEQTFVPDVITQTVRAVYPLAEVTAFPYSPPSVSTPFDRFVAVYKQGVDFIFPMLYVSDLTQLDPLVSMVQHMSELPTGARVVYTLHVSSFLPQHHRRAAIDRITQLDMNPLQFLSPVGWGVALAQVVGGQTRVPKYERRYQQIFEKRLKGYPLYCVYLMHHIDAPIDAGLGGDMSRFIGLAGGLRQFDSEMNGIDLQYAYTRGDIVRVSDAATEQSTSSLGLLGAWTVGSDRRYAEKYSPAVMVMSSQELAAFWHLPHDEFAAPDIAWIAGIQAPAPAELARNTNGVLIGDNVFRGSTRPIYLRDEDRETHMSIVGKTKVGKSTVMHNLIHQDIVAGKGVGVIDPHGSLVKDILRCSIPERRIDDVILIDIANEQYPPPLNPMAVPGTKGGSAASQIAAVLEKIYGFDNAPRTAAMLSAVLVTLWQEHTPTVRDVDRLFNDMTYRYELLNQLEHEPSLRFWEGFEKLSAAQQDQLAYPVLLRLQAFFDNITLYPMMCHPDTLDLVGAISRGKIVLVSLRVEEEKVPTREQQLVGAVLISQLQMAATRLATPTPFYLYIDEAQDFVTTSLNEMFSEVRKQGLRLTVANQFLGQLKGATLDALMGNVGTSVVFQVGPDDSRALIPFFRPEFEADDLMNLDLYRAVVKTRLGGRTQSAFSLETRAPVPEPPDGRQREARIRERSIELYTPKTRDSVLEWLRKRYPRPKFGPSKHVSADTEQSADDWIVKPT